MKTYKRELATALLVWLVYLVEVKDATIIEVLVWPIFAFAGAAFGLESYAKQLQQTPTQPPDRRGAKRSSEHPVGEDQQPNSGNYEK